MSLSPYDYEEKPRLEDVVGVCGFFVTAVDASGELEEGTEINGMDVLSKFINTDIQDIGTDFSFCPNYMEVEKKEGNRVLLYVSGDLFSTWEFCGGGNTEWGSHYDAEATDHDEELVDDLKSGNLNPKAFQADPHFLQIEKVVFNDQCVYEGSEWA